MIENTNGLFSSSLSACVSFCKQDPKIPLPYLTLNRTFSMASDGHSTGVPSLCFAVGIPKYKQRRGANWYVLLKVLQLFDRYWVRNQTTSAIESRDLGHHASMKPNSSEEYTGIDETKGESGRQNGLPKNTWGLTVIFVVVTMAAEWIPDIPYDSPVSAQAWAGGS